MKSYHLTLTLMLSILLSTICSVCMAQDTQPVRKVIYKNFLDNKYGYTIDYPVDWESKADALPFASMFIGPKEDDFTTSFDITVDEMTIDQEIETFVERQEKYLKEGVSSLEIRNKKHFKDRENPYWLLEYDCKLKHYCPKKDEDKEEVILPESLKNDKVMLVSAYFLHGERIYTLTGITLENSYSKYKPVFLQMIESFQWMKDPEKEAEMSDKE